MGTDEWLPFRKVLKMLLDHVPGECEWVLKAPGPNGRGKTNIPEAEQTLSSRTLHRIDIGLCVKEAGLHF
jgi:recombinational DNA repair ATPase RecF